FALARMSSPRLGVGVGLRRGGTAPRADRMSRGARSRRRRNLPGARTHLRAGRTRKHLRCLSGEGPDLLRGCLRSHLRRLPGWLELVDANTHEVFDERRSGVFVTLSPGDRFVYVGLDGLLPEKKGVIGVVPLLGADVDPAEPVRLRLRFEEKVGGSFAPLAPRTFYDLHGVDLADPTAWESQPVVTASDGTVWMGPA